jgi:hypothetical protein
MTALIERGPVRRFVHPALASRRRSAPPGEVGVALTQNVEDIPVLIDRPPEVVKLPADPNENFIQMPLVARLWPAALQGCGKHPAEAQAPFADAFSIK